MAVGAVMKKVFLSFVCGAAMAIGVLLFFGFDHGVSDKVVAAKPLYWVAPMDDNFRRDKPGLSPMGMDLVPVYQPSQASATTGAGVVTISAAVENNISVGTTQVKRGQLQSKIQTTATVQLDQGRIIHAHPRVEGWVEILSVKAEGDPVKKGQLLYSLYSPELVAAQDELILAMKRKNPQLVEAAERRLSALHVQPLFIDALKASKKVRQTVDFFASQTGIISQLKIRQGFFVKPGDTLMSIAALDEVWLEGQVFSRQAALISTGLAAVATVEAYPGEQWQGVVDYVYPMLDEKTRALRFRIKMKNNDGRLKPHMYTSVVIDGVKQEPSLLLVKESVIRTANQARVVLALGGGRYKSVEVALGRDDDDYFEIIQGLEFGDTVVSSAQFLLDSESSKNSDFKRIDSHGSGRGHDHD